MYKFLAGAVLCLSLAVATGCGSNYNSDEVPDISPENLYNIAKAGMATGDFGAARRYLEALDSRYPFGDLTQQAQLDLIYVYYKSRETELASAMIERFIRLSPTHPNIDYVYYMKGLTQMQRRADMIQDFLGLERYEKDPTDYVNAFNTFKQLITTYPNSIYAADARQRMIFIKDELARREMAIAQYYYERGAYLSSIRHSQNILSTYRTTDQLEPALELMARSYERLHLPEPANNVRQVMAASFGTDYQPVAAESNSLPLNPDGTVPSTSQEGVSRTTAEGDTWIDSVAGFIFGLWGADEETQSAAEAQHNQAITQQPLQVNEPAESEPTADAAASEPTADTSAE